MSGFETSVIEPSGLEALVDSLRTRGYRVLGPTTRDGAIVYDDLESAAELPIGWTDEPGRRRPTASSGATTRRASAMRSARTRGSSSCCRPGCASGTRGGTATASSRSRRRRSTRRRSPSSASAPASCTRSRSRTGCSSRAATSTATTPRAASDAFVVAVNCFEPGGTCFCVSMGTGPKADAGYDLALTEILDGEHRFLVEVGTERGADVLARARRAAGRRGRISPPPRPPSSGAAAAHGPHARVGRPPRPARSATSSTLAGTRSPSAA